LNDLHFAVCIGIDRYPGFPGRDLSSAVRDANSFRDWLIAPNGGALPQANVSVVELSEPAAVSSVLDARPRMDDVLLKLDEINERIRSHVALNPADWNRTRLYIYAAGHGVAIPNGEGALLMANAKPKLLGLNVDLSLYADWYMRCGLVHDVIVFVDCCREVADGMPPGMVVFDQCRYPAAKGTVRFVAYASRWAESAWEPAQTDDPDLARGYFTEALIEGLSGAAAEADTRQVTAASLATYVAKAVEEKTRPPVAPYPQRAEMPVDLAVRLVLRDAPPAQAAPAAATPEIATSHTATIHFPAGFAGDAVVQTGDGKVHGRWRAADGDWRITLPDTFYRVQTDPPGTASFQNEGLFALVGADVDVQL